MTALLQWLIRFSTTTLGMIVLAGGLLTTCGSFLVLTRQSRISQGIQDRVEKNLEQTEVNLEHTREAVSRIEEAIGHLTGGDTYCYLAPQKSLHAIPATQKLAWAVAVRAPGPRGANKPKYGLRGVGAEVADSHEERHKTQQALQAGLPLDVEDITSGRSPIRIGDLAPRYHGPRLRPYDVGPGETHRYFIQFWANNGMFNQFLTIRAVQGQWAWASRVERNGEVIAGSVDVSDDFPPDEQGQPQGE